MYRYFSSKYHSIKCKTALYIFMASTLRKKGAVLQRLHTFHSSNQCHTMGIVLVNFCGLCLSHFSSIVEDFYPAGIWSAGRLSFNALQTKRPRRHLNATQPRLPATVAYWSSYASGKCKCSDKFCYAWVVIAQSMKCFYAVGNEA